MAALSEADRIVAEGRARRLLDTARAEARQGSLDRSWQACLAAATTARELVDPELLAEAATTLVDQSVIWRSSGARQALCLEALGMLGAAPVSGDESASRSEWRMLVRAHLDGLSTGWADRTPAPVEPLSPREADLRFAVLQAAELRALGVDGVAERLTLAHDCVRLGQAARDDHILAWGWHWRADAMQQLGLREEFDRAVDELTVVVDRSDAPVWRWRLAAIRANVALMDDRLARVPALAAAAHEAGLSAGAEDAELFDLILRGVLARRTGSGLESVEEEISRLIVDAPPFAQGWRAEILLSLGRVDEAVAIYRALVPHLDDIPADVREWLAGHLALAEIAVAAEDRAGAARLRDTLSRAAHLHVAGPATTPYGGPVALALAQLDTVVGDHRAAQLHAVDALARAEAMRAPGSRPPPARSSMRCPPPCSLRSRRGRPRSRCSSPRGGRTARSRRSCISRRAPSSSMCAASCAGSTCRTAPRSPCG